MSVICVNGKFENENANLDLLNRGFLYADGLFETILYDGEKLRFFEDHMLRLLKGLNFFQFETPALFKDDIESQIYDTLEKNSSKGFMRVKLIVWRNTGGLYTPTHNSFSYLILCSPTSENYDENIELGIYNSPLLPHSEIGNHKTINSIYYVYAGIEKKKSGLDELILLNTSSLICECTSSNIFWEKDGLFYTPSLSTGCVAGIQRKQFIKEVKDSGKTVIEGEFTISDLTEASQFYMTNITGIRTASKLRA